MDTKIKKMHERLEKHLQKMAEQKSQTAEIEQEIKKAEDEKLSYLGHAAADVMPGGIYDVFEVLENLCVKPATGKPAINKANEEIEEGENADEIEETEESED